MELNVNIPAISVIIPMYNAEKYIEQAVDSVLNQTFKDLEVIVVDDCSTDAGYAIVQSKYGDNARVRLMHNRQNLGVSQTRNIGMRSAIGKYVSFLDNDDIYLPHALKTLYDVAETEQAEVVSSVGWFHELSTNESRDFIGHCIKVYDASDVGELTVLEFPDDQLKNKLEAYFRGEYGYFCLWNKLYLRQFLMANDIYCPTTAEDRGFTFQCMLHAKKFVKIPVIFNVYRFRPVSQARQPMSLDYIAKAPNWFANIAADYEKIMDGIDFFKQNPMYKRRVIEDDLTRLDQMFIMKYYPSGQMLSMDIVNAVGEKAVETFGEHAPFMTWLFNRYHVFYRRCMELSVRLQQLESKNNQ